MDKNGDSRFTVEPYIIHTLKTHTIEKHNIFKRYTQLKKHI